MKKITLFLIIGLILNSSAYAANLGDLGTISRNQRFQDRVNNCLNLAALNVMAEVATTASHQNRVDYARKVLLGGLDMQQIALDVLTNTTIASGANASTTPDYAISDSDIQFAVNSIFNALAGVTL